MLAYSPTTLYLWAEHNRFIETLQLLHKISGTPEGG